MRTQLARHRRLLANLAVLAALGVWFLTLAPTAIGGPAAYIEVSGHSMDGTYRTGDLILTRTKDTYAKGDIVTFKVDSGGQVIHRIIGGDGETGYTTQGDNNPDPDPWHPTDDDVVGQAWHRFEGKAWLLHLPRQPWFAGVTAGLLTLVVLGWDARPRRRTPVEASESPAPAPEPVETVPGTLVPLQRTDSEPAPRPASPTRRRRSERPQPADAPAASTPRREP